MSAQVINGMAEKSLEKSEKFASGTEDVTDDVKATQQHIRSVESELKHAKDALSVLKLDRKRLKAEKFELLNQMKQLYATLEDKEKELRDFIRAYEQRMRESEAALRQLLIERDEAEREKWTVLRHAHDESQRCLTLTTQLALRDAQIRQLSDELSRVREQLGAKDYAVPQSRREHRSSVSSMDSTVINSDNGEDPLYSRIDYRSFNRSEENRSQSIDTKSPVKDDDNCSIASSSVPSTIVGDDGGSGSTVQVSRSADQLSSSRSSSQVAESSRIGSRTKSTPPKPWDSITKVFSRGKVRKSLDPSYWEGKGDGRSNWSPRSSLCMTPLTEESITDKLRFWNEVQGLSMERWKAGHVIAWLEFAMGMGQYAAACAENVKSGKILLELSDAELETGLGLSHPLHRKKLRLAIEEYREPHLVKYPNLANLGNTWITSEWLPDIGLPQFCGVFAACLMDARLLDNLTKREMEKYLGITRKTHQASIFHGITFLRMMKYDRQAIAERRKQCENSDCDPLVWTNQRFVQWANSVDLVEYADNLKGSGIHGGLVVLEPSFNADAMAAAMAVPPSKNIIRRHLATELEALVQVARIRYEQRSRQAKAERKRAEKVAGGSLGRSFQRSALHSDREDNYANPEEGEQNARFNLRASLSRAFGRRLKHDLMAKSTSTLQHSATTSATTLAAASTTAATTADEETLSRNNSTVERHRRVKSSSDIESITVSRI